MGVIGLVCSLLGLGATAVKSKHDAYQKVNSDIIKEIDAERVYLEQGRSLLGARKYNRVMEFDVAHAKVREIIAQLDPVRLAKWERLSLAKDYHVADYEKFRRECCERPGYSNWEFRWDIDLAERNGFFDYLDSINFTVDTPQDKNTAKYLVTMRGGRDKAMSEWFEQAHPEFKSRGIGLPFGFRDYVREYARKTVYDNGYLPSSYNRNWRSHNGHSSIYDGQYLPGSLGGDTIDYWFGIPDQEKRDELFRRDMEWP